MTDIDGSIFIGSSAEQRQAKFHGVNPANNATLSPNFSIAGTEDVDRACVLAGKAFDAYRNCDLELRAKFLETIALKILRLGDPLIERAIAETGLPRPRLEVERGRTVHQIRLFADVVRKGEFLDIRVDAALPNRLPQPRPDLRMWRIPLGPAAVFPVSNFPLAFSVAGGDTSSAFAAGCPIVVKGHPGHPGTGEMVARAIIAAARESRMPEGVFSFLQGPGNELGTALVCHPKIKSVGFTGSRAGGLKLTELANSRPEPIPVFAEMSSVNPVVLFPEALKSRSAILAEQFIASMTLGAGQFCTNPGILLGIESPALDHFLQVASETLAGTKATTMLTPEIYESYQRGVAFLQERGEAQLIARGKLGEGFAQGVGALFATTAKAFMANPLLGREVFGASSLVVRCKNAEEIESIIRSLEGQLTITLHVAPEDVPSAKLLVPMLERKAGRLVVNGWPTGVEVASAMVHGGPYPATSDGRSTSVGTAAIERFLRPVCYQNFPEEMLPSALRNSNSNLHRYQNGEKS